MRNKEKIEKAIAACEALRGVMSELYYDEGNGRVLQNVGDDEYKIALMSGEDLQELQSVLERERAALAELQEQQDAFDRLTLKDFE